MLGRGFEMTVYKAIPHQVLERLKVLLEVNLACPLVEPKDVAHFAGVEYL